MGDHVDNDEYVCRLVGCPKYRGSKDGMKHNNEWTRGHKGKAMEVISFSYTAIQRRRSSRSVFDPLDIWGEEVSEEGIVLSI